MASIAPSERLRRQLEDVIGGACEEPDPIEAIGRLGARLILQQALEEELSEFLGRERYERRGEPISHRNGYERVTVKTTAGPLELGAAASAQRLPARLRQRGSRQGRRPHTRARGARARVDPARPLGA